MQNKKEKIVLVAVAAAVGVTLLFNFMMERRHSSRPIVSLRLEGERQNEVAEAVCELLPYVRIAESTNTEGVLVLEAVADHRYFAEQVALVDWMLLWKRPVTQAMLQDPLPFLVDTVRERGARMLNMEPDSSWLAIMLEEVRRLEFKSNTLSVPPDLSLSHNGQQLAMSQVDGQVRQKVREVSSLLLAAVWAERTGQSISLSQAADYLNGFNGVNRVLWTPSLEIEKIPGARVLHDSKGLRVKDIW